MVTLVQCLLLKEMELKPQSPVSKSDTLNAQPSTSSLQESAAPLILPQLRKIFSLGILMQNVYAGLSLYTVYLSGSAYLPQIYSL